MCPCTGNRASPSGSFLPRPARSRACACEAPSAPAARTAPLPRCIRRRACPSTARPGPPARAAEVAAVLADDGVVAAFAAERAFHHRGLLLGARRLEDAHLARGIAALVEDSEHRVA